MGKEVECGLGKIGIFQIHEGTMMFSPRDEQIFKLNQVNNYSQNQIQPRSTSPQEAAIHS